MTTVTTFTSVIPVFMPNGPWFPASGHIFCTGAPKLPVSIWEIGNTASDHLSPAAPGRPGGSAAWYNGPADNEQSELYAALKLLSPVSHESIYPAQFRLRVDNGSRTIAGAHTR